jgi:hypothetical protein
MLYNMADETGSTAVAETAKTEEKGTEPTQDVVSASGDDKSKKILDEEFDPVRAMKTIEKLRGSEKELKSAQKRLAEYEAAEKKRQEAEMSETQRMQARIEELTKSLDSQTRSYQEMQLRGLIEREAGKAGFLDTEAAYLLLDKSSIQTDTEGRVSGVPEALKILGVERPYLKGQPQQVATQQIGSSSSTGNPATRSEAPGSRIYQAAEIADRDFYLKHKEDIDLAYRQGRIQK